MKKYFLFLLPWYMSIFCLVIFGIHIPLLFIIVISFIYFYITKSIVINYKYTNDYLFYIVLLYVLNTFLILLLFYYNNYIVSLIIVLIELYIIYKIKNV